MSFLTETAAALLQARYGMARGEARRAYIETTGLPFVRQMEIILPGDSRNGATVEAFEAEKRRHLMDFHLFPDALPAIATMRRRGMKVCVSSGNVEDLIIEILRSKGVEVDLVLGYRPGFEKGLDHFEYARQTFGSTFDRLVFIGDSQRDGLSAQRAGVRFIARAGLLSARELRMLLPGVPVVDSLEEVLPLLGIKGAQEDCGAGNSSRASTS